MKKLCASCLFLIALPQGALADEPALDIDSPVLDVRRIEHRVHVTIVNRKTLELDGEKASLTDLKRFFVRERFKAEKSGLTNVAVIIAAPKDTRYGDLEKLVVASQEAGYENFIVQSGGESIPFRLPLAAPRELSPEEDLLPPWLVRLRAANDGKLAGLRLNERALRNTDELQQQLLALLGNEAGPESLAAQMDVELDCDEELRLEHVLSVYDTIAHRTTPDGKEIPFLRRIWLFGGPPLPEEVELEEVVEVLEIEELDVESFVEPDVAAEREEAVIAVTDDPTLAANIANGAGSIRCRAAPARPALIKQFGGNEQSEKAIDAALQWLARQQATDGSWSFADPKDDADSDQEDSENAGQIGATGLALMTYLGVGQTHLKSAQYHPQVQRGLAWLVKQSKPGRDGGDLTDARTGLIAHGVATIALCEAYALTQDKTLMKNAQAAIDYIVARQDETSGGWAHLPGKKPDVLTTGLLVKALHAGHIGYLTVPPQTVRGATRFLDSVQADDGATYGLVVRGDHPQATPIGLLSRMYLSSQPNHPALRRGVAAIAEQGPQEGEMLRNLCAGQLLFHHGGEPWQTWNEKLRDMLVESQVQSGPHAGSWHFKEGDWLTKRAGRLYTTAAAALTLETYYRELPISQPRATDEFPLD